MSVWQNEVGKEYENICRLAVESDQWFRFFKQSQAYQPILEHVSGEQGRSYLESAFANATSLERLIGRYQENDALGGASVVDYGPFIMSPSTARYVWIASDIHKKLSPPPAVNIIEVGGGYGGLAKTLTETFTVGCYINFDLLWPKLLWKKYADAVGLKTATGHYAGSEGMFAGLLADTLFLSTWALCELPPEVQDDYIEKLGRHCSHGYLICNDRDHATEARIRAVHPHVQLDKEPCSDLNYVLWWK